MTDSSADRIVGALDAFLRTCPGIDAAAVVSYDGLALASALPDGLDEDRLAAMAAALLSLGEQATLELGRGTLSQLFAEGRDGGVYALDAGGEAVLVALTAPTAKIGMVRFEARRAAASIASVLAPISAPADTSDELAARSAPDTAPSGVSFTPTFSDAAPAPSPSGW